MNKEDYIFFWNGIYSQWAPFGFHDFDGVWYNCAEQYMMAHKAMTFHDLHSYVKIMKEESPYEQKALGKKVKKFDLSTWNMVAVDIVTKGNYFKFTQNESLLAQLKSTGNKHLVEASPYDPVWGIGLSEDAHNIEDQSTWQGTNWLGVSIMRVRHMLYGTGCVHEGAMEK